MFCFYLDITVIPYFLYKGNDKLSTVRCVELGQADVWKKPKGYICRDMSFLRRDKITILCCLTYGTIQLHVPETSVLVTHSNAVILLTWIMTCLTAPL
jgi:hypothetical protein